MAQTEGIDLQHLYRAMGFLGEPCKDQTLRSREVVKRFQTCFCVRNVCIVADREMISKEVTDFLESPEGSFSYILGVRLRAVKDVREQILTADGDYQEIKPVTSRHSPLKVKEVIYNRRRYIICFNEVQARKNARDREAVINALKDKLKHGDKWNNILHDINSVEEVAADISGKQVIFRSELKGCARKVFQAAGVTIPPAVRFAG